MTGDCDPLDCGFALSQTHLRLVGRAGRAALGGEPVLVVLLRRGVFSARVAVEPEFAVALAQALG